MTDELLPCPFCGGQAIYVTHTHYYDDEDTVCVFCNSCKSLVILEQNEAEGINDKTKAEAIAAWNTRGEIIRCNSCKYYDERATSNVYTNRHWCDRLAAYVPPNGFCSFGKRRWLVCKCGEEIESTGGGFAVCPSCGRKVANE